MGLLISFRQFSLANITLEISKTRWQKPALTEHFSPHKPLIFKVLFSFCQIKEAFASS